VVRAVSLYAVPPPPRAHLQLFWRKKKSQNKNFEDHIHHNHLTSINSEIDRRDDGDDRIAR
jgi:hypothetical protein